MNNNATNDLQLNLQLPNVEDYIAIVKRRKISFALVFSTILAIAILFAYLLPSIYLSESTILIERQDIPTDLVETTVTGFVQERIEGISKRLLTRKNLWEIIKELDLYPNYRSPENRHEIVNEMHDSIFIEMEDVQTHEPGEAKQGLATIAFTIAFEAKDPNVAQIVTNELASLFIEENSRLRSEHAAEVLEFLEIEAERLNAHISELEDQLADFKQSQQSQLPELMDLNLQLYEKTDNEIERTKEQIRELEDSISAIQAELAITKPNQDLFDDTGRKVLTGGERLSLLTAEYLRLSARYSAQHPDLIKLRREINALGGERDVSNVNALIDKLAILKNELSIAKQKYSDDHPDVIRLQQSVMSVERGLQNASVSGSRSNSIKSAPDNPRYVSLKTQLDTAQSNLTSERAKLVQLNEKLSEYETRLFQTPEVERDYLLLTRDYDNARRKYNEIKDKQLEARLAIELESSSKGERFTILQSAYLPSSPERPNRIGILMLGFLLAVGGGIGIVTIREYMDRTIYNVTDLVAAFRAPPLVTIPYISN